MKAEVSRPTFRNIAIQSVHYTTNKHPKGS